MFGVPQGLSGEARGALALAWLISMGMSGLVIGINILARLQDAPSDTVAPFVEELTSLAALAIAFLAPIGMALWLHRTAPRRLAAASVLGLGLLGFSALHIGGCAVLRTLLYPLLMQRSYAGPPLNELPYEFGKDVLAFTAAVVGSILVQTWRIRPPQPLEAATTFDIQDGPRLIRAQLGEILAVRSAGNYAEFLLADGRRPLMRSSLASLYSTLEPFGFVRTHRSWLVNPARVTGLRPEGSGDYAVDLGAGVEAPLSRRFPAALQALKA